MKFLKIWNKYFCPQRQQPPPPEITNTVHQMDSVAMVNDDVNSKFLDADTTVNDINKSVFP